MNWSYRGWYVVLKNGSEVAAFIVIAQTERSALQQVARRGYKRAGGWSVERIGLIEYAHAWQIHQ